MNRRRPVTGTLQKEKKKKIVSDPRNVSPPIHCFIPRWGRGEGRGDLRFQMRYIVASSYQSDRSSNNLVTPVMNERYSLSSVWILTKSLVLRSLNHFVQRKS